MDVATVATTVDGRIVSVSPRFLELVGLEVADLARVNLVDLAHPHDAPRTRALLGDAGAPDFDPSARLRFLTADGAWTEFDVNVRTADDGRRVFSFAPTTGATPAAPQQAAPQQAASQPAAPQPAASQPAGPSTPSGLRQLLPSGVDRNLLLAGAVVVFAFLLRAWDLASLPTGFHGDEGVTGLEAQRVLDQGSIGVYTGSALGQPTAPFYVNAITVGLFGNTVWATRIVSAIAGAITVAVAYRVAERRYGHRIGVATALALATMTWHIHFSRIAFGIAWWPLVVLLAVAAIDRAATEQTRSSWFAAGGVSVFGLYVYNSHWGFGPAVIAFVGLWLVVRLVRKQPVQFDALMFGALGAAVIALPMARYILDDDGFFNHFELVSRRSTDEWMAAGAFERLGLHAGWYVDVWKGLLWDPVFDGADASGINKPIPTLFVATAAVGIVDSLRRFRTTFTAMLLATLVLVPVTTALTFDALNRRTFALSPLIAILVGIGAVRLLEMVERSGVATELRKAAPYAMVALAVLAGAVPYFTNFRNSDGNRGVFSHELTLAIEAVEQVADTGDLFVNWYSPRHAFDYPTIEFLLDDVPGETRAPIGQGFVPDLDVAVSVEPDAAGRRQTFVLVGPFADELERVRAANPNGQVVLDRTDPRLVVYDAGGSAPAG